MAYIEALILVSVLLYLFYKWSTAKYGVLKDRGVPHESPTPLVGNIGRELFQSNTSFIRTTIDRYLKHKDHKVYGYYNLRDPIIIIHDTELIKKVGIKDFDSFPNHQSAATSSTDSILAKSLINLQDQQWREMRNTLTPTFTGSKMRLMFELINECSIEGVKYIDEERQRTGNSEVEIEIKDYFTRYANDVIATAAFGIKVNSFKDKNNQFFTVGKTITQVTTSTLIKAVLVSMIPKIMKVLRISIFNEKQMAYLNSLIFDAIKYRQEHHIVRPDMIHLLLEAKRNFEATTSSQTGEHAQFNDEDLLAQCMIFFFAGFDTVSRCLCLTTWELLTNIDVQERLYEEILETEQQLDGKPLTYDALTKMKYMDMVLSESLRKWPPAIITDRVCSADYKLTDDDGNLVANIKKGDMIFIPIVGLHYDPAHFSNPSVFDPERFADENKHQIKPMTYLPFGVGPRNCIGNRLALMETKAIIYHLLLKYRIAPTATTSKDLMADIRGFQLEPKNLFPTKFIPRQSTAL